MRPRALPARPPRRGQGGRHAAAQTAPAVLIGPRGNESAAGPDFERLSYNLARLLEQGGRALAAYLKPALKPVESGGKTDVSIELTDAVRSFSRIAEHWLSDPARSLEAQSSLMVKLLGLLTHSLRRISGEQEKPFVPHDPSDKRFAAPEWRESPFFDFLRQAHAIISDWAEDLVAALGRRRSGIPATRRRSTCGKSRALSRLRIFSSPIPRLMKETWETSGDNLARGAALLAQDIEAGKGTLKISRCDTSKFELGVNIATTPGKVIFRNDLIELIQYAPATETVIKRPLLIIPPWINKFYILDLNPEKSFVRFAVSQGLTVFIISWVNPDIAPSQQGVRSLYEGRHFCRARCHQKSDRRNQGQRDRLLHRRHPACHDARLYGANRRQADIERRPSSRPRPISARLAIFACSSTKTGCARSKKKWRRPAISKPSAMASAFNMLRPEDLIWSFVVNNYMKGKPPLAFDLLAWNSDSTRMTAANHLTYLRECYLENRLAKGKAKFGGKTLDLSKITDPRLSSGDARGSYRPGEIRLHRRQASWRQGPLCARRFRPHRGCRQSGRQAEISILARQGPQRANSRTGSRARPSTKEAGGLIGSNGSSVNRAPKCRRGCRAKEGCRRSAMRRVSMCGSAIEAEVRPGTRQAPLWQLAFKRPQASNRKGWCGRGWSGRRESNPRMQLGKLPFYH